MVSQYFGGERVYCSYIISSCYNLNESALRCIFFTIYLFQTNLLT